VSLLDQYGRPISSQQYRKAAPPKLGEAFGNWAGRDLTFLQLPGGGTIGFDLNNLTLSDYRKMTSHYQIHASLAVLGFLLHQAEWHIECDDKKIAAHCEENLAEMWTPLARSMNTAHWAGFAPNVLQWDNDIQGKSVQLTKVKDLIPEECFVNWKYVDGYAPPGGKVPPKIKVYDGLKQFGSPWPVPAEATLWYPMLMTHGDYYGTKLLKPAFTSWFFSMLLHLFANRYYERFGEPTPIGRAPMDEDILLADGTTQNSRDYMLQMLMNIRSRSTVVLPNDRNPQDEGMRGSGKAYDYEIEYLESQMRGADFERYMTRLDEEMSIGLFTPILLLRTADVGSYNLGQGHMQVYLWMLNSLNGDRKQYIDNFVLSRMVDYNFSPKAPRARIKFRKMGNESSDLINTIVQALISSGKAKVDLDQLGDIAGLTLTEIRQLKETPGTDPGTDPNAGQDPAGANPLDNQQPDGAGDGTSSTATAIVNRVGQQVTAAFKRGEFDPSKIDLGYRRAMVNEVGQLKADAYYSKMTAFLSDVAEVKWESSKQFCDTFAKVAETVA